MKTIQLSERELSIVYSLMAPPYRAEDIRSDEFNEFGVIKSFTLCVMLRMMNL
ncbi:hypothetical protein [Citrobacter koseri]|uniref:hypothetical protein n=1 Tax=Citrobacter koseri TaxID=545 RepID=UPI0016431E3E|nr:hypothetical protein [Citrobacter koseri]